MKVAFFPKRFRPFCLGLALILPWQSGFGYINPNFTPTDLVNSADRIHILEVEVPVNDGLTARVQRTLKGGGPETEEIRLVANRGQFLRPEEVEAIFPNEDRLPALLFTHDSPGWGEPEGAILIDTHWFSIFAGADGIWEMDTDQQDVEAVWAGSSRQLERAVRYVLEDNSAEFPVASVMRWEKIESLGRMEGPARGILRADLGEAFGAVLIFLSPAGDRLYQVGQDGNVPTDLTEQANWITASQRAVVGDFTGNGKMDMASWDGGQVVLAVQGEDGRFSSTSTGIDIADCRSMEAVDIGGDKASGILIGRGEGGPALIVPGEEGFLLRELPSVEHELGTGGVSLVADIQGNGYGDVVQAFSGGLVIYPGRKEPGSFGEAKVIAMRLSENPHTLLAADFDLDGNLDLILAGNEGIVLLRQEEDGTWVDATQITGELWRHANAGDDGITAMNLSDINADGRPGVSLMMPDVNPMVFFNRGFAVFGLAMDLVLADSDLDNAGKLTHGQVTGMVADVTGNAAQDLLAVDPGHEIWLVRGKMVADPGLWLTVSLPGEVKGPRTVSISMWDKLVGMKVVRPGQPIHIGCREPGPIQLSWTEPNGTGHKKEVIVIESTVAVLKP